MYMYYVYMYFLIEEGASLRNVEIKLSFYVFLVFKLNFLLLVFEYTFIYIFTYVHIYQYI